MVDEWSAEEKLVSGLQRRQLGLSTQPFQDEVLGPFDRGRLGGKSADARVVLAALAPSFRGGAEPCLIAKSTKR